MPGLGKHISPVSGEVVKKETPTDVVDYIVSFPEGYTAADSVSPEATTAI